MFGHAHDLEHGAHRAAGDDAVAFGCRLHEHARRAVLADHRVVQRAVLQLHLDHLAARRFHRLCTATGTSLALPLPMPTRPSPSPTTVSAAKPSDAAALDHLGDAVDRDHLFASGRRRVVLRSAAAGMKLCHLLIPCGRVARDLELEAGFARGVGQRLDAAVVLETRRDRTRPSRCRRPSPSRRCACRRSPRRRRCRRCPHLAVAGEVLAHVGLDGRGAGEHLAPSSAMTWRRCAGSCGAPSRRADALQRDARAGLPGAAQRAVRSCSSMLGVLPYFFFVSLIITLLVGVAHALALVRLGRTVARELRRRPGRPPACRCP